MSKTSGGQPGNDNARQGCMVRGAFRRVLAENEADGRESLLVSVRKVVAQAEQGDLQAAKLLYDKVGVNPGSKEEPIENNHSVTVRYVGG